MSISFRYYLFPSDGSLRRVPKKVASDFQIGDDTISEFAGTRQRVAHVVVDLENGRPVRIMDARGFYWQFDADGRVDESAGIGLLQRIQEEDSARRGRRGRVVSLLPEIARKEQEAKDRWTLSGNDLDRIAADLWPSLHATVEAVSSVKGTKLKQPPVTYEARRAIQNMREHVNAIADILSMQTERALKGVVFKAGQTTSLHDQALWKGIADAAKRQEAIRAAHRTGRGKWSVVIEASRINQTYPYLIDRMIVDHVQSESLKEAIKIGRQRWIEKASWLGKDVELSISVKSELEWEPEDWEGDEQQAETASDEQSKAGKPMNRARTDDHKSIR